MYKSSAFKHAYLQALAVSSVKVSCESVLESFVSKYENHFDSRRNLSEEGAKEEFEIAMNGPCPHKSDSVIFEAMQNYWRSQNSPWHFYKTTVLEDVSCKSVVVDRLCNESSKFLSQE